MRMWQRRTGLAVLVMVALGGWLALASGQQKAPTAQQATADTLLGTAQYQEQIEGKLEAAIATYRKVLAAADATRGQKARAQFRIGACYERLGLAEARKAYEAVVADYADQAELVAEARARLAAMAEPPSRSSDPLLRQIWTTSRKIDLGRVSPDGRSVVGVDWDTGDVVIRSVATGQIRRLTAIPEDRWWTDYAESPIWSRDGRQIAYWWETGGRAGYPGTSSVEFRIANLADGTSNVVPVNAPFDPTALDDWSPDGRRLLARIEEGHGKDRVQHLAWVSTSGGTVQLLASSDPGNELGRAFLSPDGGWIVTRLPGDQAALSVIAAQGGPPRTLMPAPSTDSLVGWSPDGAHVLFISRDGGDDDLMAVRVVDGRAVDRPMHIRTLPASNWIDVSQTGALVYQGVYRPRINVYRASFDRTSGRVGSPSRVDVSTGLSSNSVSWSPDGRRLAYVSWPDGRPARTLSIWSADSGQTRSFSLPFNGPRWTNGPTTWSADGRWVYAAQGRNDTARESLYRINTDTGLVETVLPPSPGVFPPEEPGSFSRLGGWSPDGRMIYRAERRTQSRQPPATVFTVIIEHRVADHAERELFRTDLSESWQPVTWQVLPSPDGSQLAFPVSSVPRRTTRIMLMAATGGPATILAELPMNAGGAFRWTPDGQFLVLWRFRGVLGPAEALIRDVATGAEVEVAFPVGEVHDVAVSPDGKEIAYVGGRMEDEGVWMLENFLPKPKEPTPKK